MADSRGRVSRWWPVALLVGALGGHAIYWWTKASEEHRQAEEIAAACREQCEAADVGGTVRAVVTCGCICRRPDGEQTLIVRDEVLEEWVRAAGGEWRSRGIVPAGGE